MPLFPSSIFIVNLALLLLSAIALHDVLAESRSSKVHVRRRMHNEVIEMLDKRLEGKFTPEDIPAGIPIYPAYVAPEAKYVNEDPQAYVEAYKHPTWREKCGEKLDGVQAAYGFSVSNFAALAGDHVYLLNVSCVQTSADMTITPVGNFTIITDFSSSVLSEVGWTKDSAVAQAAKLPSSGSGPSTKPGGGGGGGNNKHKNGGSGPNTKSSGSGSNKKSKNGGHGGDHPP